MSSFYQMNNEVLKFEYPSQKNEIAFNHYIMRKENLERINGDLPKGCFKLTLTTAEKDLGISKKVLRRIIEEFIKLDIITRIDDNPKGSKLPSIYAYNTVKNYEKKGTEKDTEEGTEKDAEEGTEEPSKINDLNDVEDTEEGTEKDTEEGTEKGTSKKEYIKRKDKKKIKNKYTDDFEKVWKYFLSINRTGNKSKAFTNYKNTLLAYSVEDVLKATEYYFKYEVPSKESKYIKTGQFFLEVGYISDFIYKAKNNVKSESDGLDPETKKLLEERKKAMQGLSY